MQAIVLANLVLVHLTGAASLAWLAPLFVLTIAAPLLEGLRDVRAYRVASNLAVLAVFGVLVRHVLRAELSNVLEDGLVLAVLCQVHLLNNLRVDQRPDLLFFNGFLIATLSGSLSDSVGFPLVLLVFVPGFVIGLQLLSVSRGGTGLAPEVTRRIVRDGARRATALLAASALVFLFWPRDFERKAFFHDKLDFNRAHSTRDEVGFNERLRLERLGTLAEREREVLRVTATSGSFGRFPTLWRGATLAETDGVSWFTTARSVPAAAGQWGPWRAYEGGATRELSLGEGAPSALFEVLRLDDDTDRLFLPLLAHGVVSMAPTAGVALVVEPDDTLASAPRGPHGPLRYRVSVAAPSSTARGGARGENLPDEHTRYIALPKSPNIRRAARLAARLATPLGRDVAQHELVEVLARHLTRNHRYVLPGGDGAAESLDAFLAGDGGGACEYFAAALATMLRSVDVPCRVVTGLRLDPSRAKGRSLAVGSSAAHAWVEVLDPEAGWYEVDPTPLTDGLPVGTGFVARLRDKARASWAAVTGLDATGRAAAFLWLRERPAAILGAARREPAGAVGLGLVVLLGALAVIGRRRARTQPAVRSYRRALRSAGLRPEVGETPRELLERAGLAGLDPGRFATLCRATRDHEEARYATGADQLRPGRGAQGVSVGP